MHISYGRFPIFSPRRSAVCNNPRHRSKIACTTRPSIHLHFSVDDSQLIHKIVHQIMNQISHLLIFFVGEVILLVKIKISRKSLSCYTIYFFCVVTREISIFIVYTSLFFLSSDHISCPTDNNSSYSRSYWSVLVISVITHSDIFWTCREI